jgi:predicted amidohydrolase YtcJ
MTPRADLVVRGQIVVDARPHGLETAEAIAVGDGRVLAFGAARELETFVGPTTRTVDARDRAVVPGIHDFHIHLVGLARAREAIDFDGAADVHEVAARVRHGTVGRPADAWLTGRGWSEAQLGGVTLESLEAATRGLPAFFMSHDGHSAWASARARDLAGVGTTTPDPVGGRIERGSDGSPTGILREAALELVQPIVTRLQGDGLRGPLEATVTELVSLGVTGATDAGDYTDRNGIGADAAFGDSHSSLTDLGDTIDGRLRLTIDIPAAAIPAAAERGRRTGQPLDGRRTMRFGWAKEYSDGALGSGTAALFEPRTCDETSTGILRVDPEHLDALFGAARGAGIGMAVHAIGDRAVATVLDAVERAPARAPDAPPDRMEHVQLLRAEDASRFAPLSLTASVQPIHAAADRDLVEACWDGRQDRAYAFRALLDAGALLAAGSDAPIESFNPWLGVFSAVHRRFPQDTRGDWHPVHALSFAEALSAYTRGPAMGMGATDEGHLRAGARADFAVLNVDLETLRAADERLAEVRADLTVVDGAVVYES